MLGEFEIPGEETQSDRVGGQAGSPEGTASESAQPGGAGSGAARPDPAAAKTEPGGQPAQPATSGEPAAGGGGEPQNAAAGAAGASGAAGQAEGVQVAQLSGGGGEAGGEDLASHRPRPVAMGDKAMQIPPVRGSMAGVSADQPAGTTQHHDQTGSGGKPPVGDNRNKGAERGRVMPQGL